MDWNATITLGTEAAMFLTAVVGFIMTFRKVEAVKISVADVNLRLNGRLTQLLDAVEKSALAKGRQQAIDESVAKAVAANVVTEAKAAILDAAVAGEAKGRADLHAEQAVVALKEVGS